MNPADQNARLLSSLGLNGKGAVSFRNRLVNGNFSINQRGAGTGPAAYPPGAFIRDRWRAGPNGCTVACAEPDDGDVIIYIGAGSITQAVEGGLHLPEGGSYCLSWQGTALGRLIGPGLSEEYARSTVLASGLMPRADVTAEFSVPDGAGPVYVSLAQLEPGATATTYEHRDDELRRCQRYARAVTLSIRGPATDQGQFFEITVPHEGMRGTPSASVLRAGSRSCVAQVYLEPMDANSSRFGILSHKPGDAYTLSDVWLLAAELD